MSAYSIVEIAQSRKGESAAVMSPHRIWLKAARTLICLVSLGEIAFEKQKARLLKRQMDRLGIERCSFIVRSQEVRVVSQPIEEMIQIPMSEEVEWFACNGATIGLRGFFKLADLLKHVCTIVVSGRHIRHSGLR